MTFYFSLFSIRYYILLGLIYSGEVQPYIRYLGRDMD